MESLSVPQLCKSHQPDITPINLSVKLLEMEQNLFGTGQHGSLVERSDKVKQSVVYIMEKLVKLNSILNYELTSSLKIGQWVCELEMIVFQKTGNGTLMERVNVLEQKAYDSQMSIALCSQLL